MLALLLWIFNVFVCVGVGSRPAGSKPHPHHPGLMVHPHHPMLTAPTSSLEALRAHAQAAAMQSPVPLPPSHGTVYLNYLFLSFSNYTMVPIVQLSQSKI